MLQAQARPGVAGYCEAAARFDTFAEREDMIRKDERDQPSATNQSCNICLLHCPVIASDPGSSVRELDQPGAGSNVRGGASPLL